MLKRIRSHKTFAGWHSPNTLLSQHQVKKVSFVQRSSQTHALFDRLEKIAQAPKGVQLSYGEEIFCVGNRKIIFPRDSGDVPSFIAEQCAEGERNFFAHVVGDRLYVHRFACKCQPYVCRQEALPHWTLRFEEELPAPLVFETRGLYPRLAKVMPSPLQPAIAHIQGRGVIFIFEEALESYVAESLHDIDMAKLNFIPSQEEAQLIMSRNRIATYLNSLLQSHPEKVLKAARNLALSHEINHVVQRATIPANIFVLSNILRSRSENYPGGCDSLEHLFELSCQLASIRRLYRLDETSDEERNLGALLRIATAIGRDWAIPLSDPNLIFRTGFFLDAALLLKVAKKPTHSAGILNFPVSPHESRIIDKAILNGSIAILEFLNALAASMDQMVDPLIRASDINGLEELISLRRGQYLATEAMPEWKIQLCVWGELFSKLPQEVMRQIEDRLYLTIPPQVQRSLLEIFGIKSANRQNFHQRILELL